MQIRMMVKSATPMTTKGVRRPHVGMSAIMRLENKVAPKAVTAVRSPCMTPRIFLCIFL